MHFKTFISTLFLFAALTSCKEPEPRRPISHSKGNEIDHSIKRNKALIQNEENLIKEYITKDTLREYLSSSNGFWYTYTSRNIQDSVYPKTGNEVIFEYSTSDLKGNLIYTKEEIGIQHYKVDQEDQLKGIRHAIKLLKKGESAIFLFPSHLTYGYVGDKNKISKNEPLAISITLKSIEKQ